MSVVSTMLDRVLASAASDPFHRRCAVSCWVADPRRCLYSSAPCRPGPVVQTYGLTETASQLVTLAPEDALIKLGSAGKPLFGSQIRIEPDGEIAVQANRLARLPDLPPREAG